MLSSAPCAQHVPWEYFGGSGSSRSSRSRATPTSTPPPAVFWLCGPRLGAWPLRSTLAAAACLVLRKSGRGAVHLRHRSDCVLVMRARNDGWFDTVKTTELEEALRALGFDAFPKMQNRQQVASWIQKLRIPYELLEGALKEVRQARKAQARRRRGEAKASKASKASKGAEKSTTRRSRDSEAKDGAKKKKRQTKFKDAGLNKFSEAELRTVLNMCDVQGTSMWPKEDLVQKLRSMGLRQRDVQDVLNEVAPQSRPPRSGRSSSRNRKQRPRSRAEREFYGYASPSDQDFVREFIREEYDDWDDRYDDVDDYFDFTMDDEPWESIPWDFDDYLDDAHEETQYRSSRSQAGPTQDYYYYDPGQDPWTRTYSAAPNEPPWQASSWPKQPKLTPEETMNQALKEGWKSDSLSHMQALLLLGLSGRPSPQEVSKVRRQMALRWHPDKNPENANANAAFQLVMAAAVKLS
ncbi:unnamed protein product [Cladocopium goreaui]|uniref:DnaJ-like subfamily B member 8 n=1 Tax=Cladocopium goreaui TaxID=2562237 RepID=A0A9P1BKR0_9DINO|nr:unnamed protein product [Cladocopium goreaui]